MYVNSTYFFKKGVDNYDITVYNNIRNYDIIVYKGRGGLTREFVYTKPFISAWKAMGLSDADLKVLENILLNNTEQGDKIPGTGGARKLRIQLEGRGKRGGARVIYIDILTKERLYLLFAYPKNVQEDLTPEQKKQLKILIDAIKKE